VVVGGGNRVRGGGKDYWMGVGKKKGVRLWSTERRPASFLEKTEKPDATGEGSKEKVDYSISVLM